MNENIYLFSEFYNYIVFVKIEECDIKMKKIILIAIILALTACTKDKTETADISTKELLSMLREDMNLENVKTEDITTLETAERYGISPDDVEEGYVYYTTNDTKADKLIILKAKDNDTLENVQRALSSEIVGLNDTWKNDETQRSKIENHLFKTKDKYVILAITENADNLEEKFDKALEKK